eukprot:m.149250 g.149250  ORF g.149250 m.149250 type:complete len:79 (+) comp15009_c0_seq1:3-239(+)
MERLKQRLAPHVVSLLTRNTYTIFLQDDFKVDVADPRFSAVFDRSEYYIDPTQPAFKNTDQMRNLIKERQKRRRKNNK